MSTHQKRFSGRHRVRALATPDELDACGKAHIQTIITRFAKRQHNLKGKKGDKNGYDSLTALLKHNWRHIARTKAAGHRETLFKTEVLVGKAENVPEIRVFETQGNEPELTVISPETHMDSPTRGVIEISPSGADAVDDDHIDLVRHYLNFREGDIVRIWGTEGRRDGSFLSELRHTQHLVCEIEHEGVSYTFGLGFLAKSIGELSAQFKVFRVAQNVSRISTRLGNVIDALRPSVHMFDTIPAAIYSPDFLFNNKLQLQSAEPDRTYLRLLTQSYLQSKHIEALRKHFNQLTLNDLSEIKVSPQIIVPPHDAVAARAAIRVYAREEQKAQLARWFAAHIPRNRHTMEDVAEQAKVADALRAFYPDPEFANNDLVTNWKRLADDVSAAHEYSGIDHPKYGLFSPIQPYHLFSVGIDYTWTLPDTTYCELSAMGGGLTTNCSKFLVELFEDLIDCKGSSLVVNPSFCRARHAPPTCDPDDGSL